MHQVEVGTVIQLEGNDYMCVKLERIEEYELAIDDWITRRNRTLHDTSTIYLEREIEPYESGHVTHFVGDRIKLECPLGPDRYIWTKYKVVSVKSSIESDINIEESEQHAEQRRVTESHREGTDNEIESTRTGNTGGEGPGTPSAS